SIEGEVEVDFAALLSNALAYSSFSASVLAAAVGSTTGEVPTLPSFCGELCRPRRGDDGIRAEATMLAYAEVGACTRVNTLFFIAAFFQAQHMYIAYLSVGVVFVED
ncbi:unnamed protein product, partial [Laminaria digitata]